MILGPGSDENFVSAAKSFLESEGIKLMPRQSDVPYRPWQGPHARALFLLFLHLASLRLGLLYDLLLQHSWDGVVVVHFHVEATAALGH